VLKAARVNPLINEVWDPVAGSWRFRWVAVGAAAALALAGWLVVFGLQDRYEAGASVFVDTPTPLKPALQVVEQDVDTELNFARQSLLADPTLQRIAREAGVLPASSSDFQQQQLLAQMRGRIDISVHSADAHEQERNTAGSIYHIGYWDHDRLRSLQVVRILLGTLVNDTLTTQQERSENAQQLLEAQIAEYEKRLRAEEDQLAAFKSQHEMPAEQSDYFAELEKESEAAAALKAKRAEAQSRAVSLTRQLDSDVDEAQHRLDDLLLKYTEAHPDVIDARQKLEQLKQRRAIESVRLPLNQVEVDIENLNTELADHESRAAELRRDLDAAPQVEAEFARLNRDYEANKAQYTVLVALRQKVPIDSRAVRFRVVQPPAAAYSPVWPRRRLWLTAILAGALAAGAALAYGLNHLYPVVSSAEALARAVTVPLLGQIPGAFPERERRALRRDLLRISMATACLFVAFGVAIALNQSGYRLNIMALSSR
jgi:polysaccharide chain length determinant protein (PEP-CTERM system associated)